MKHLYRLFRSGFFHVFAALIVAMLGITPAATQDHAHHDHQMTAEQFTELREKVPLYREFTDEQIMENMAGMGPGLSIYVSDAQLVDDIGVLALGHGFGPQGNELFRSAYETTATEHPTSLALGMAMMSSSHIQAAVDDLTTAGAEMVLVIPVTTLKTGKLIGQWRYIFGEQDEAPWMSVERVQSDAQIVFGPTPTDDRLISEILLAYAKEMSSDPRNEVVAIIGHGATNAQANAQEMKILERHSAVIRSGDDFARVQAFTLQDDAPSEIRSANIERMRAWIREATDRGQRVIVVTTVPVRARVQEKIRHDLEGLDYVMNERGVVEHPLFSDWIESTIAASK
jgi:hypothetical protein